MTAEKFNRAFGALVKKRRDELQIAQDDVATVLGIPRSGLSALESGSRAATFFEAKALMSCLGIRPKDVTSEEFYAVFVPKLKALTKARDLAKLRKSIGAAEAYEDEESQP